MQYKEIECQTILRKFTAPDHYFHGDYSVDVYQNCAFACRYCDSSYNQIVYICCNAVDVLRNEIEKVPIGRIIIGSVHDPYQPIEEAYGLVHESISLLLDQGFSVHVLTKSPLVLRDLKLLQQSRFNMVTISMISLDPAINNLFEPNVPSVDDRLNTVYKLVKHGIFAGVAIFPIIPFIVDEELLKIIPAVKQYNAHYVVYKYLELKGRQKSDFFQIISEHYPRLLSKYQELYKDHYAPNNQYIADLDKKMVHICSSANISCGIPIKK